MIYWKNGKKSDVNSQEMVGLNKNTNLDMESNNNSACNEVLEAGNQ